MMRKKIVLFTMLLAGIVLGYLFYFSWAFGFTLSKLCSGKRDGEPGRVKSIIIPWRRYRLHLHHWLLSAVVGVTSALSGFFLFRPELFYGFLSGLVFQGIYCYTDWYRILKKAHSQLDSLPRHSSGWR